MTIRPPDEGDPETGAQSVARWARETPHAIALVEGGCPYTYADLAALVVKTTKCLFPSEVPAGAIAGIECSSNFMHLVLILACECLGMTTVSLVPSELTGDNELLPRCALLYIEAQNEAVCGLSKVVPLTIDLITMIVRTPVTQDDFGVLDFQPAPGSGGRIVKTSGTTGKQKFMRNCCTAIGRAVTTTGIMLDSLGASYNFLCLYPFSHRPSYTDSVLALRYGRTIYSGIAEFHTELTAIGASHTVLLPADAAVLCTTFPGRGDARPECSVQINGGSLSRSLRRALLDTFASTVCNTYSMNETNYVALVDEYGVGALFPDVEVRILRDDGQDAPPGESGVIMIRSPRMVTAYLWNDALTKKHFVSGWHVTGDLGYCPASRQLVVVARVDDMLNIGGVKVPPQPIENEIKAINGVHDAVLLGIENSLGIAELHLLIERSDPARDPELETQILPVIHRYGRDFVAHYCDSLPRTNTGKVQRASLRQLIEAKPPGHPDAVIRSGQKRVSGDADTTDRTAR